MVFIQVAFLLHLSSSTNLTPYGEILGKNSQTIGYSNGNDSYISYEDNYVNSVYTGMPWQCVEYARRWLIIEKNLTFDSVDGAADIWSFDYLYNIVTEKNVSLKSIENGSKCKPVAGNLLVYKRGGSDIPYGHVAIITDVTSTSIKVAEQNWNNDYWPGDYSRELKFNSSMEDYFVVDDYEIFGWMEYSSTESGCQVDFSLRSTVVPLYLVLLSLF